MLRPINDAGIVGEVDVEAARQNDEARLHSLSARQDYALPVVPELQFCRNTDKEIHVVGHGGPDRVDHRLIGKAVLGVALSLDDGTRPGGNDIAVARHLVGNGRKQIETLEQLTLILSDFLRAKFRRVKFVAVDQSNAVPRPAQHRCRRRSADPGADNGHVEAGMLCAVARITVALCV